MLGKEMRERKIDLKVIESSITEGRQKRTYMVSFTTKTGDHCIKERLTKTCCFSSEREGTIGCLLH